MTKGYYHKQMWYLFLKLLACMAFLILLIEFLTSCEHKDLCYDYPHRQNVEVTFDWSEAPDANPSTMSLYLYLKQTVQEVNHKEPSLHARLHKTATT